MVVSVGLSLFLAWNLMRRLKYLCPPSWHWNATPKPEPLLTQLSSQP